MNPEPASNQNTASSPEPFYRERLATFERSTASSGTRQGRHLLLLLASLAIAVLLAVLVLRHAASAWTIALPALAFLTLPAYLATRRTLERETRLLLLYESALARITHQPSGTPQTGEDFRDPAHLYDRDLNLLGPDSLFAILATTRTGLGQRALAHALLYPPAHTESLLRQQAIQELTPLTTLRESITLLGPHSFAQPHPGTFDRWLDEPPPRFPSVLSPLLYTTSTLALALLLSGLYNLIPWSIAVSNVSAVLGLQAAIALLFRPRALPILEATTPRPAQVQIVRDGLTLLRTHPFTSALLQQLQAETATADAALAALQLHLYLVEQRKTEWCYLPCLFFNAGTHAAILIARWKLQHAQSLRQWLSAWSTFDALNAFAAYAFEHPTNTYPELLPSTHPPTFEATALTHPLLPAPVPNDIALTPATRFYLISGSNMSGKSTLLRAIGLAVVLARAGAPIPATRARLTPLAIGASLALNDSLAEGKSRFLAEVLRLQQILATARHAPTLFLIDELFSGTNSTDRLTAAEAVLDALLEAGALGALSTHDLALTTLATQNRAGLNRHMASPDPADPLAFDYLLKPGVNITTNALAFLRLLNL